MSLKNQKTIEDTVYSRTADIELTRDDESELYEVAFSSESPYRRWFGDEVLSHDKDAVDLSRLNNSAPLLVNHDRSDQVGVLESAQVDSDKIGRAKVRFSNSVRGQEIKRDVDDKIRTKASISYRIIDYTVEEREGQPDLITATRWVPTEVSIVSIPADDTVGFGREDAVIDEEHIQLKKQHQKQQQKRADDMTTNVKPDDQNTRSDDEIAAVSLRSSEAELKRCEQILELGEKHKEMKLARQFITEKRSIEDFNAELVGVLQKRMDHMKPVASDNQTAEIGMSDEDVKKYSFIRALRVLANPSDKTLQQQAKFEIECSRAAEELADKSAQGIMVPFDVLSRAITTSVAGTPAGATGGYTVATDLLASSFVDMLRNKSFVLRNARALAGLIGNVDIPTKVSGAGGFWLGEDDAVTAEDWDFGEINLTPKTVAGMTEITRKMLKQSSLDVEALVREDLAAGLALQIDAKAVYGTGATNQPLGIVNVTGINAVDFTTASQPTYAEVVDCETQIATDNADVASMLYALRPSMKGYFKTTQKFAGTNGMPIWEPGETLNGYRAEVSNQILGTDLIMGNFMDLLIGMWGGLDLTVDPYTHSARGRLRVVAMQDADVAVRRAESFCLGRFIP